LILPHRNTGAIKCFGADFCGVSSDAILRRTMKIEWDCPERELCRVYLVSCVDYVVAATWMDVGFVGANGGRVDFFDGWAEMPEPKGKNMSYLRKKADDKAKGSVLTKADNLRTKATAKAGGSVGLTMGGHKRNPYESQLSHSKNPEATHKATC
jgi:hypothetical protein